MKVLLAVYGNPFAQDLTRALHDNGLVVDVAWSGDDLQELARRERYDLLIIALRLPNQRGVDIVKALRRQACVTPIMAFSQTDDADERVEALNAGADDCITNATSFEELLARSRALMRRPPQRVGPIYTLGNVQLDASTSCVTIAGNIVTMPRREVVLLEMLMRNSSSIHRERLQHILFTVDSEVTPNALEAAISRLRRRLKASDASIRITASRGFGYSLTGGSPPPRIDDVDHADLPGNLQIALGENSIRSQ